MCILPVCRQNSSVRGCQALCLEAGAYYTGVSQVLSPDKTRSEWVSKLCREWVKNLTKLHYTVFPTFDARQINCGMLMDTNAVAYDAQRAFLVGTRTGNKLQVEERSLAEPWSECHLGSQATLPSRHV